MAKVFTEWNRKLSLQGFKGNNSFSLVILDLKWSCFTQLPIVTHRTSLKQVQ